MSTVQKKIDQGFHSQGWCVIGRGGAWAAALRPLNAYIEAKVKKAVETEREACAKVCEAELNNTMMLTSNPLQSSAAWNAMNTIRARSKT